MVRRQSPPSRDIPPFLLFCAFIMLLLTTISLPATNGLDIVRAKTQGALRDADNEVRFGIWGACFFDLQSPNGGHSCPLKGTGYTFHQKESSGEVVTISSSWTGALVIHPVSTVLTFMAPLAALSSLLTRPRHAVFSLALTALATLSTFVGLVISGAFVAHAKSELAHLQDLGPRTVPGPGFYLALVAFILVLVSCVFSGLDWRRGKDIDVGDDAYWESRTLTNAASWWQRRALVLEDRIARPH